MTTKTKTSNGNAYIGCELEPIFNGTSYVDYVENFKYTETLNQVPHFECNIADIQLNNSDIIYGNYFCLRSGSAYVLPKMMISTAEHQSNDFLSISCDGWGESKLKNFLVGKGTSTGSEGRPLYDGIVTPTWTADTIVDDQLALYTTNVLAGTLESTIPISIRSENDTLTSFFAGIADVLGLDWYYSYPADLSTTSINIGTRGTDKSGSIVFYTSGANENCIQTSRAEDYDSLKNVVKVFGYGDGLNQKESISYHATSTRSALSVALSSTDVTSMTLTDASTFPASGSVWVGCEKITYDHKSGNELHVLTRGVAFQATVTVAYAHAINSPVYDAQYTQASPQSTGSGSSINTNLIRQSQYTNKTIIDQSTLDIIAEKICLASKGIGATYTAPERIVIEPEEIISNLRNISIGDYVSITDSESGLSGSYRITSIVLEFSEGQYRLEYSCSNNPLMFSNEVFKDAEKGIKLSQYMQGATNIFSVNETENAESAVFEQTTEYSTDGDTIALWHCNDGSGTSITDSSGNGYTLTMSSSAWEGTIKKFGTYSIYHDNVADKDTIADDPAFDLIGDATWEFWVYPTSNNAGSLIGKHETGWSNGYQISKNADNTIYFAQYGVTTGSWFSTTATVTINQWNHIIIIRDTSALTVKAYINGVLDTEQAYTGTPNTNAYAFKIGSFHSGVPGGFIGYIDEIRVSNCVRLPNSGSGCIDLFFEIPDDAVAINLVKLSYRNEAPRIWNDVTATATTDSIIAASQNTETNKDIATTWTDSDMSYSPILDSSMMLVEISNRILTEAAGVVPTYVDVRVKDTTNTLYYPNDSGARVLFRSMTNSDEENNSCTILVPGNVIGNVYDIEMKVNNATTSMVNSAVWSLVSRHSHEVNYDIQIRDYSTTDIAILTSNDTSGVAVWTDRTAAIEAITGTLTATESGSELGIDMTSFFPSTGWKGIRLATNGNSRHKVQVTVKCYVQSKV